MTKEGTILVVPTIGLVFLNKVNKRNEIKLNSLIL